MLLLIRAGCQSCHNFTKAVMEVNRELPRNKQIEIIDCRFWEDHNVKLEPIMDKLFSMQEELEKQGLVDESGYPVCFLITDYDEMQGILVEPAETKVLKRYFLSLLKDEIQN